MLDVVPALGRDVLQRDPAEALRRDARVGEHDIEAAELLDRGTHAGLDVSLGANVEGAGHGLAAALRDERRGILGPPGDLVGDDEGGAFPGEQ